MTRPTRLFALTQARAPDQALAMHAFVHATPTAVTAAGLPQEWTTAIGLCQAPRAVAEVAARMNLPLTTTTALLTELIHRNLIVHQPPMTESQTTDVLLLQRIKRGLQALG